MTKLIALPLRITQDPHGITEPALGDAKWILSKSEGFWVILTKSVNSWCKRG